MNPKIDKVELELDHQTMTVSGPIEWDSDEESATFVVAIAQVRPKGHIVYATGRTTTFWPADDRWSAVAVVVDPGDQFMIDEASGWAVASVKEVTGAFETYPWSVDKLNVVRAPAAVT